MDAEILRMVALRALADARSAWQTAQVQPSEGNFRHALRLCVLAARALLRVSSEYPDEEDEMIERAMLLDEAAVGLKNKLARLLEPTVAPT